MVFQMLSLKTILEEKYGLFWFIRISLYENTNGLDKISIDLQSFP